MSLDPLVIRRGRRRTVYKRGLPDSAPTSPVLADHKLAQQSAAWPVMAGTATKVDPLIDDCLDPEALGERGGSSSPAPLGGRLTSIDRVLGAARRRRWRVRPMAAVTRRRRQDK